MLMQCIQNPGRHQSRPFAPAQSCTLFEGSTAPGRLVLFRLQARRLLVISKPLTRWLYSRHPRLSGISRSAKALSTLSCEQASVMTVVIARAAPHEIAQRCGDDIPQGHNRAPDSPRSEVSQSCMPAPTCSTLSTCIPLKARIKSRPAEKAGTAPCFLACRRVGGAPPKGGDSAPDTHHSPSHQASALVIGASTSPPGHPADVQVHLRAFLTPFHSLHCWQEPICSWGGPRNRLCAPQTPSRCSRGPSSCVEGPITPTSPATESTLLGWSTARSVETQPLVHWQASSVRK